MGVDIAEAALGAGHLVVATARDTDGVTAALGEHENLFSTSPSPATPGPRRPQPSTGSGASTSW